MNLGVFKRKIDVDAEIQMTPLKSLYASGDKGAHVFELSIYRGGQEMDLSGASAQGYFIRADGYTVPITGAISGNVVTLTLSESCYYVVGNFNLIIKVSTAESRKSVFWGNGYVVRSMTEAIVDEENVIPSLDELLAQIAATESAANAANSAAVTANAAASEAESKALLADNAASQANAEAAKASVAAKNANGAALKLNGMTVSAKGLASGELPTALFSDDGEKYNIVFGIPRGNTGATPQITVQVKTGEPGTAASVKQTGTAEAPVIELTIPRGDIGSIGTLTINGKTPDGAGAVQLSAADVGALGKDAQAKDSAKLAGKVSEYYIQPRNLLDNSDFTNPVNQRGQSTYATSAAYTIDRWLLEGTACRVVSNSYVSIEANSYLVQRIQNNRVSLAKTYTLAVKDSAGNIYVGDDAGIILTDDSTYGFWSVKLKGREIVWAALYEGVYTVETLPPYTPKGYAAELAECQRYYRKVTDSGQNWGFLIKVDGDLPYCLVACDAPMRATPSVVFSKRQYFSEGWKDIEYNTIYYAYGSYKVIFTAPSDMTNGLYLFAAIDSLSADL